MTMTIDGNKFLECLKRFNAKERFFLVAHILGNVDFKLGDDYRKTLGEKLGLVIPVTGVFAAMDYHLDWLFASLYLASGHNESEVQLRDEWSIEGTQEDVDFIIAFKDKQITHVVLIEAKGVTGWSNEQMSSKNCRYKKVSSLFGDDIKFHFVITSPNEPKSERVYEGAIWMRLPIEKTDAVSRWDAESNSPSAKGDHWKIINRK